MNIKELKPKYGGRYSQGYINPESCKKLFPELQHDKIIYRSSYEKKFILWLENCKMVRHWGSECVCIPYRSVLDNKVHRYYADYFVELVNGECWVVEIKPFNQTHPPVNESNQWAVREYAKNKCKWNATMEFCKDKGYKFRIFTEKTINKLP